MQMREYGQQQSASNKGQQKLVTREEKAIRCADCPMMRVAGHARITRANFYTPPRGKCFCEHPDAEQMFKEYCPKSPRMPCFIAFTKPPSDKPAIKTTPRWCPRKRNMK